MKNSVFHIGLIAILSSTITASVHAQSLNKLRSVNSSETVLKTLKRTPSQTTAPKNGVPLNSLRVGSFDMPLSGGNKVLKDAGKPIFTPKDFESQTRKLLPKIEGKAKIRPVETTLIAPIKRSNSPKIAAPPLEASNPTASFRPITKAPSMETTASEAHSFNPTLKSTFGPANEKAPVQASSEQNQDAVQNPIAQADSAPPSITNDGFVQNPFVAPIERSRQLGGISTPVVDGSMGANIVSPTQFEGPATNQAANVQTLPAHLQNNPPEVTAEVPEKAQEEIQAANPFIEPASEKAIALKDKMQRDLAILNGLDEATQSSSSENDWPRTKANAFEAAKSYETPMGETRVDEVRVADVSNRKPMKTIIDEVAKSASDSFVNSPAEPEANESEVEKAWIEAKPAVLPTETPVETAMKAPAKTAPEDTKTLSPNEQQPVNVAQIPVDEISTPSQPKPKLESPVELPITLPKVSTFPANQEDADSAKEPEENELVAPESMLSNQNFDLQLKPLRNVNLNAVNRTEVQPKDFFSERPENIRAVAYRSPTGYQSEVVLVSPVFNYRTSFFEEPALEKHGVGVTPLFQPFVSGAKFYAKSALYPLKAKILNPAK